LDGYRGRDDRGGQRQEGQPGLDRRVALGVLQEVGEEQERAEHSRADEPDRKIRTGARAVAEDPQRQ
jgi:hypothetical protein